MVRLDVFDAKMRVGDAIALQLAPERVLRVEILDDGLDDDVGAREVADARGEREPRERGVPSIGRQLALLDGLVQRSRDGVARASERAAP